MPSPLAEYLTGLTDVTENDVSAKPNAEDWIETIQRIHVTGRIAEITEETWFYFLEVLPPVYHAGNWFLFAEGEEPLALFWRRGGKHYCRRLTEEETQRFCELSGLPPNYGT